MDHGKLRAPVRNIENSEGRMKIHQLSEEANVGLADEVIAIYQSGKKKE